MGEWTVNGRDGTTVSGVEQMMGMLQASVYEKAKELQPMLDADPLAFEKVEQATKALFE